MLATAKRITLGFISLAIIAMGLAVVQNVKVFADYTVSAGQKCQDNSTPTSSNNGGTQTYTCTGTQTGASGTPAAGGSTVGGSSDKSTNCAVEGIGWILCPIIKAAAVVSDKTFDILANNFLQTDPGLVSDNSGTKTAWEIARNIANIMFIIAFLIIIVSQVTSMGINNYGIKKMIPKLIIAAIAVNVSYIICQGVVDLTNILGFEIQNALSGIANSIGPSVFGSASQYGVTQAATGGGEGILAVVAVAALAVAGVVWLTLPLIISIILFVLITVVTIIVILLLRKALLVLLIVISPIAFVMYLLPNTEKLFNKWMKMFGQLLMVFPVVALLFGAGQLASTIILVSGAQSDAQYNAAQACNSADAKAAKQFSQGNDASGQKLKDAPGSYDVCGGGSVNVDGTKDGGTDCGQKNGGCKRTASWTLALVATGIAVAPLMAVWSVLKGALSAAGAIGGKISSVSGKLTSGQRKRMGEAMDLKRTQNQTAFMDGSRRGRFANRATGFGISRNLNRRAVADYAKGQNNREFTQYVANKSTTGEGEEQELSSFGKKLAGGSGAMEDSKQRVMADALNAQRQSEAENVKAEHTVIDSLGEDKLKDILDKGTANDPKVAAALERFIQVADKDKTAEYVTKFAGNKGESLASRTLGSAMSSEGYLKATDIDQIRLGQMGDRTVEDMALQNILDNQYSPEKIATSSKAELDFVRHVAAGKPGDDPQKIASARSKLTDAVTKAKLDPILSVKMTRQIAPANKMEAGDFQRNPRQ